MDLHIFLWQIMAIIVHTCKSNAPNYNSPQDNATWRQKVWRTYVNLLQPQFRLFPTIASQMLTVYDTFHNTLLCVQFVGVAIQLMYNHQN